jgi:HK97 family phage major capsid protein
MKRLMKLREDKKALVGTMRGMVEAGDFSPEQDTEYKGHEAKLAKINADIEREEALAAQEDQVAKAAGQKPEAEKANIVAVDKSEKPKFATIGEQLKAVANAYRHGVVDHRLYGAAGMSEGVAPEGGFMVQTEFAAQIIEPLYSPGSLLSRCTNIPISSNSNGVVSRMWTRPLAPPGRAGAVSGPSGWPRPVP